MLVRLISADLVIGRTLLWVPRARQPLTQLGAAGSRVWDQHHIMEHPPSSAPDQAVPTQPAGVQRYNDEFMMYVFKVEMCKRVDKHDREKCPYAHPGELARRRHPALYQALPCPEARAKKMCPRLENCNCSHSTFEFWLHPDRYKTFLCERGTNCNRPICFFAHSDEELRELPQGLQRTKSTHKPSANASSSTGGASSSRHHQQQHISSPAGPGNLVVLGGYGAQMQQQGSDSGPGMMSYAPMMQQQQQQGLQQQMTGMQYVAVPVQQTHSSDGGLATSGTHSPSLVMQQLLPGHPGPPIGAEVVAAPAPPQVQHTYPYPYQQIGYAGAMQGPPHALQGNPGLYAQPPQQQQVMIGYEPVQLAMPGGAGPGGVVMVRPGPQRGSTVAVIPAGPSAWSGSLADSGEAPSLEVLTRWHCQGSQQQQVQVLAAHQAQQQQQVSVYAAAQQQVLGGQQQQPQGQAQLLPGQAVMVVMRPEDRAEVGWRNMQPGP